MASRCESVILGDSFVSRLAQYYPHASSDIVMGCKIVGVPGLSAKKLNTTHRNIVEDVIGCQPTQVFLHLSGNDIDSSDLCVEDTVANLQTIVGKFYAGGIQRVFVGNIMARGKFIKDPRLTCQKYDHARRSINNELATIYGTKRNGGAFVNFHDIYYPYHFLNDLCHIQKEIYPRYWGHVKRCLNMRYKNAGQQPVDVGITVLFT